MKFCQFNGLHYTKIIGIEMEKGNFEALRNFIKYSKLKDVILLNIALSSEKGELTYHTTSNFSFFNANLFKKPILVSSHEEKQKFLQDGSMSIEVDVHSDTNDNILSDIDDISSSPLIIKLNAMGSDYEILLGAQNTLKEYKPVIVLEYGTFKNHILDIPFLLKDLNPEYHFYLRQKKVFGDCKTILYCINGD